MGTEEASTGRCLCGDLRFEYRGAPIKTVHCHCESCRRHTSSPFTTFIIIEKDSFRYTRGSAGRLCLYTWRRRAYSLRTLRLADFL
jgi:hypothetical protein